MGKGKTPRCVKIHRLGRLEKTTGNSGVKATTLAISGHAGRRFAAQNKRAMQEDAAGQG